MSVNNVKKLNVFLFLGFVIFTTGCEDEDTIEVEDTILKESGIEMVKIPDGSFFMGSPQEEFGRQDDEILHQVSLDGFSISKYEITNAQYAKFLNANGIGSDGIFPKGNFPSEKLIYDSQREYVYSDRYNWGLVFDYSKWSPVEGYEDYPVINVTWYGALEYASYVGGQLPTEAQWEYACRANTNSPFYTGDCLSDKHANYSWAYPYNNCVNEDVNWPNKTQRVGTYPPNNWGVFDMHGNVREWCMDWYGTYDSSQKSNPNGSESGEFRIIRGGSYNNTAAACRSANREDGYIPSTKSSNLGFRVVLNY